MQTQETNNNLPEQDDTQNYMSTLTSVVNKVVKSGYTDSFKVTKQGLYSAANASYYTPLEVNIINFYRFEGESDPADNTIMYVIETHDGLKGTLIDAYGPYSDETTNKFMNEVEEIQKVNKSDLTFTDSSTDTKETPDDSE
ncbi:MAG TPA: hypothetical protein VL098_11865 [Flavipsychrobacter sp.]|nr:hypothetical protein [Flavipsychrobacter sp.]